MTFIFPGPGSTASRKDAKHRTGRFFGAAIRHAVRCGLTGLLIALCGFAVARGTSAQEQSPQANVPQDAGPNATPAPDTSDWSTAPLRENEAPARPRLPDQPRDLVAENGKAVPVTTPLIIDMPELEIVGKPSAENIVIPMPELLVVGKPRASEVVIALPDLVIIGRPHDEERLSGGLGETTTQKRDEAPTDPAIGSPPAETTPAAWCLGNYTAHAGRGTGTAAGIAMPVGQVERVPAKVTAVQCRQTLRASIAGAAVALERTDAPDTYAGTIDLGDGAARVLTLTCGADLNLRGSLVAADANLRITRPIWLIRDPASPADLPLGCDP